MDSLSQITSVKLQIKVYKYPTWLLFFGCLMQTSVRKYLVPLEKKSIFSKCSVAKIEFMELYNIECNKTPRQLISKLSNSMVSFSSFKKEPMSKNYTAENYAIGK